MWHNLKLTFALGLFLFLTGHLTYSADEISRLGEVLCGVKNVNVLWLHDVSGAMRFQLHFITEALTSLWNDLKQLSTSSDLAVSVFTDKPSTVGNQTDEGKCYHNVAKFDTHETQFNYDVTNKLSFRMGTGGDKKEAQLLALLYGVMDNEIGWQENNGPDDLKVVILMTDNLYHKQGDSTDTPASIEGTLRPCEEFDYPSFEVLAAAFAEKNAVVIFVVTENFEYEHKEHLQEYITLARAMKVKYAIIDVGDGQYAEPTWLHENVKNRISDLACGKQYEGTTDGGTPSFGYDLCGVENVQALWLHDVTPEMASQRHLVHNVLNGLQRDLKGVSSLSDLAISHFTDTMENPINDYNYCYGPYSKFGDNKLRTYVDKMLNEELYKDYGTDEKHSQLLSLLYGVLDPRIGWWTYGSNHAKVVILMTDAPYHEHGDNLVKGRNATADGAKKEHCGLFDYPTIDVLVEAFKEQNVTVIFVVAEDSKGKHASIVQEYEKLSQAISEKGVRSTVIDVKHKPIEPTLLDKVKKAISDLACGRTYGGKTYGGNTDGDKTDGGKTYGGKTNGKLP